ncbi:ASKHA domain-containing protein [Candidatus Latescibacterota bacterium]
MAQHEVRFQPDGINIMVESGTLVADAIKSAGIKIQLPCGGTGKCGKCGVEIHPGAPEPSEFDVNHLTEGEIARGMRLACKTKVTGNISVLINPGIRIMDGKILVDGIDRTFDMKPLVTKTYAELPEPTLEDQVSDLFRVKRALDLSDETCPDMDIDLLRELPGLLSEYEYKITVVTAADNRIIDIEPGDTTGTLYGIAFDIGTTTVVGTIIDLLTGREISYASRLNTQVVYGEDTISRIKHVIENDNGSNDMAEKILTVINEIIAEAAEIAGIDPIDIYEAVFVGNTAMTHLFLGLDPAMLAKIPFVSATNSAVNVWAFDLDIGINPRGNVYVLPNVAGFVGSDTVGVMLACNYLEPGPTQLIVDVGTNGELALRHNGALTVCSTAAGPALEGAALTSGMRALRGAIEHVKIVSGDLAFDVIGDETPIGLCGSAIIDIVAVLLEAGIIDTYGAIVSADTLKDSISESLWERIITINDQPAFLLYAPPGNGTDSEKVVLTQKDVRQIQLAKGAIRSGINLILKKSGLNADDLEEILLAGAFGNYITKSSAQRIGLLPDIPQERIRFIGNAASTGAKMALLSKSVREDADRIRHKAHHIELAALPEFMTEFSDNMIFP